MPWWGGILAGVGVAVIAAVLYVVFFVLPLFGRPGGRP
jgi:hypothetical protein